MRFTLMGLLGVWWTLVPTAQVYADAIARLTDFQRQVKTFSADFQQLVTDDKGAVIQESAGSMVLERPFLFRWDYLPPYEQEIVSDGKRVWFFDADLEQVTVKSVGAVLSGSAALILSAGDDLKRNFRLKAGPEGSGLAWVEATPLDASNVRVVRVGFRGRNPEVIELYDSFGQMTRLEFSEMRRNPIVAPGRFRFVPPAGVDVLYSEG